MPPRSDQAWDAVPKYGMGHDQSSVESMRELLAPSFAPSSNINYLAVQGMPGCRIWRQSTTPTLVGGITQTDTFDSTDYSDLGMFDGTSTITIKQDGRYQLCGSCTYGIGVTTAAVRTSIQMSQQGAAYFEIAAYEFQYANGANYITHPFSLILPCRSGDRFIRNLLYEAGGGSSVPSPPGYWLNHWEFQMMRPL